MNSIELKTLGELLPYSFYIPPHQRGYRWTKDEVSDLLNDINEFVPEKVGNSGEETWYCLQPIVVKDLGNGKYEVIDGQQRLTTVYLILHCLNEDYIESKRKKLFSISYATNEDKKLFLRDPKAVDKDDIDSYYIHNAYTTIEEWFEKQESTPKFDKDRYRSKLISYTKVIWYETAEENPIAVFTRLNIGKISLTDAELIKALFLNSSRFKSDNEDAMRLRRIEIANEWDSIETALQNDKMWLFLSNDTEKKDNRIEYIFDLMNDSKDTDPHTTFRFFYSKSAGSSEEEMNKLWEEVRKYYQRFDEWFRDRELYHLIGFIIRTGISDIKDLYDKASSSGKDEFKDFLKKSIEGHFKVKDKDTYKAVKLIDLDYTNSKTMSALLLYNILTMLENGCETSYFPFDEYKRNRWNIEHIAPVKEPDNVPKADRKEWLDDVSGYIDTDEDPGLRKEIEKMCGDDALLGDDNAFLGLFDRVMQHFNKDSKDTDGISNLALLDEKTNKGYKNAVFPVKRKDIIRRDREGKFVPICTRRVFLKYFSDYPHKISFWTQEDREKYEEDLRRVLKGYLEVDQ